MPEQTEMPYDADRVIRRLAERLALLTAEHAKLEDVVTTLMERTSPEPKP